MSFIDGINDHSASEYIRLFKQLVITSKVPLLDKAKSVVVDVAKKVICSFLRERQNTTVQQCRK